MPENITLWLSDNWEQMLAVVGIGSGSSLFTKKLVDQKQDKKIKGIEKRIDKVETDLNLNTQLDNQFRMELNTRLGNLETQGKTIIDHLLNKK